MPLPECPVHGQAYELGYAVAVAWCAPCPPADVRYACDLRYATWRWVYDADGETIAGVIQGAEYAYDSRGSRAWEWTCVYDGLHRHTGEASVCTCVYDEALPQSRSRTGGPVPLPPVRPAAIHYPYDRYTGLAQREMDNESGLQYTRARHYDPRLGRFVQRDPGQGGLADYTYGGNRPTGASDPSGMITIIVHGTWAKDETWWRSGDFAVALVRGLENTEHGADLWRIATANKMISQVPELAAFGPGGMFSWSGGNDRSSREAGAQRLFDYIRIIRRLFPKEEINVITHSHGGNVARMATALGAKMDHLVLLANPFMVERTPSGNKYLYPANPGNVSTPILNIYSPNDPVQTVGATTQNHEGSGGDITSFRTEQDPAAAGEYMNIAVPIPHGTLGGKDAAITRYDWLLTDKGIHSQLHGPEEAAAAATWIANSAGKHLPQPNGWFRGPTDPETVINDAAGKIYGSQVK